jgi:anti-sigma28 factor (negative regulator of flagellin synthesis)
MRIDPNVVVSPIQLDPSKARAAGTGSQSPVKGDVVELSAAAKATAGAAPTNTDRLNKIRALLDAGDYAVDLDKLASRIVDDDVARTRNPS